MAYTFLQTTVMQLIANIAKVRKTNEFKNIIFLNLTIFYLN